MKLPNSARAVVHIGKLLDYCLNPEHPHLRNKARVFGSIGARQADAEELKSLKPKFMPATLPLARSRGLSGPSSAW